MSPAGSGGLRWRKTWNRSENHAEHVSIQHPTSVGPVLYEGLDMGDRFTKSVSRASNRAPVNRLFLSLSTTIGQMNVVKLYTWYRDAAVAGVGSYRLENEATSYRRGISSDRSDIPQP